MNFWFSAGCAALFTLWNGFRDTLPCLTAVILHEAGHIFVCASLHVSRQHLRVTPFGFSVPYSGGCLPYRYEFCISAAGPIANLLGFLSCFFLPCTRNVILFGSSCLSLAVFNLLPIRNLDGYELLVALTFPVFGCMNGARICHVISVCAAVLLFGFSALWQLRCGGNLSLLIVSIYLLFSLTKWSDGTR